MKFRPKPAAEDAVRIAMSAGNLPLTTAPVPPAAAAVPESGPIIGRTPRAAPVVQINFKATEEFAILLAELSEPDGGIRRYLARVLHEAGHPVPAADLNPPTGRRRRRA